MFHTLMLLSLAFSLPAHSLKINKVFRKKKKEGKRWEDLSRQKKLYAEEPGRGGKKSPFKDLKEVLHRWMSYLSIFRVKHYNQSEWKMNWDETTQHLAGYIKEFKQIKLFFKLMKSKTCNWHGSPTPPASQPTSPLCHPY